MKPIIIYNKKQEIIKNTRLIAINIWILVFYKYKNLDKILNTSFDFKKLETRDKSFLYLLINTAMRRHNQAETIYNKYSNFGIDKKNRFLNSILTMATIEIIWLKKAPYAVLNEAVKISKKLMGEKQSKLVNAILRKIVLHIDDSIKSIPENIYNLPEWLLNSWTSAYGKKNVTEIVEIAMNPPPLDIMVSNKISKSQIEKLKSEVQGIEIFPNLIRCNYKKPVETIPYYSEGVWWIQDAASQVACNLLISKLKIHFSKEINKIKILDMCSAPGGKTAQLLDNGMEVISIEKSKFRSKEFLRNMKRLNFNPLLINVEAELYKPENNYDVILIDAPCSSTGTIRKNPDIFIKPPPENLNDLTSLQDKILENAAKILNQNGLIMYVTCSLQKIEGERRIEKFLQENENFSIIPFLQNEHPKIESCITENGFIRILPNHFNFNYKNVMNGSDGFFIALLKMEK